MDGFGLRGSARRAVWSRSVRIPLLALLGCGALAAACAIGRDETGTGGAGTTTWTTGGGSPTTTTTAAGGDGGGGSAGGAGGTAGSGGTPSGTTTTTTTTTTSGGPYRHTITIDGNNDFAAADERFDTTTGNPFYAYVAWDESFLYVAAEGPDIAGGAGAAAKWLLIYLGGANGTTTGTTYGLGAVDQQPTLPFEARYHVQWCASNTVTLASEWTGSAWEFQSWDFSGDVYQNGMYVELRIPLADIGAPETIDLHISMVNEADGGDWTWSGVPSDSFTDGVDPDYGSYYSFDLGGLDVPADYSPL